MKLTEYNQVARQNPEYRQAEEELHLIFALGDAILHARLQRSWSQTELAQRVGTKQANVSRIEAGLANPTLDLIRRLCQVLELDVQFSPKLKQPCIEFSFRNEPSTQTQNAAIKADNWPQPKPMTDYETAFSRSIVEKALP